MIDNHILEISNQASLNILADYKTIEIKHKFRLGDKSNLGMLFFLCGGIFLLSHHTSRHRKQQQKF